jgi:hypothetical protein
MSGLLPIPQPNCTCEHHSLCDCTCHGRACDPGQHVCHADFLPDEGGLTPWGCPSCTPGLMLPHAAGCPAWLPASALPAPDRGFAAPG